MEAVGASASIDYPLYGQVSSAEQVYVLCGTVAHAN